MGNLRWANGLLRCALFGGWSAQSNECTPTPPAPTSRSGAIGRLLRKTAAARFGARWPTLPLAR